MQLKSGAKQPISIGIVIFCSSRDASSEDLRTFCNCSLINQPPVLEDRQNYPLLHVSKIQDTDISKFARGHKKSLSLHDPVLYN